MTLPPRLSLTGSHVAAGVIVRHRAEALARWTPGAVVHELEDRVLVLFGSPERLRAEHTRGALVVARGALLTTLPLPDDALPDAPPGALIEARGGALCVHPLGERTCRDPIEWIALDAIELLEVAPLGPEPARALAPRPKVAVDAREAIGAAIPELAPGAREAGAAIARALDKSAANLAHALPPAGPLWLGSLLARVRALFGRRGDDAPEPTALARRGPSLLDRVRAWFSRQLLRTRLSRYLARRQAEYLARMFELFDRGDVREALRWAIPLGGDDEPDKPLSLGVPRPRESLALTLRGTPATSTLGLGGDLYSMLRQRYLRVLDRLREEGLIDEAAFVLADLLADPAGAVALLERHGRIVQAARLAEARDINPSTQVRLWMLARDVSRAIATARRHDVFEPAIALLRRDHPEAAHVLALEWASLLAEAGDPVGAVDAAHAVPGAERLVSAWLELAIEVGGRTGARMLAMRAVRRPELFDDSRARVLALTGDDSPERTDERAELARGLTAAGRTPIARALAAPALRALWRDGEHDAAQGLEALVDGALRADRPPTPARAIVERLIDRSEPAVIGIQARDAGSIAVRDLALLPSGKLLVALGEAGLRLVSRDGRNAGVIDAPADALVMSDHGTRAIAIARRGELHRLTRVDLADRRAQPWWEAHLVSYARTFDGARWLVSDRGIATLIDPLADEWSASARLEDEVCVHVERARGHDSVLITIDSDGDLSRWVYDERLTRLRERAAVAPVIRELMQVSVACAPDTWAFGVHTVAQTGETRTRLCAIDREHASILEGAPIRGTLAVAGGAACAATVLSAGVRIDVVTSTELRTIAHVILDGARECCTRIQEGVLLIGDDRGRALAVDLYTGALLRDLRIRA